MARKVFISFLGTGNYLQTHYELNGEKSAPVRFVQEALISFLCKDWTENDRIFIFCTKGAEGSETKNWFDNGHTKVNEDAEIEKIGLEHRLRNLNLVVP